MKILNKVLFMEIKNYLVALIVAEKNANEEEIKKFIENTNKNLSIIEKIKNLF